MVPPGVLVFLSSYDQIPEPINRSVTMKSGLIVTRLKIFIMSPRWQQNSQ